MKQLLSAALLITIIAGVFCNGCTPATGMVPRYGLAYRLHTMHDEYYEYQPLDLVLVVANAPDRPRSVPVGEEGGQANIRRSLNADKVEWISLPVVTSSLPEGLSPGQTLYARIGDPTGRLHLPGTGTWIVNYDFHDADTPTAEAVVSTREIYLRAIRQPVNIPSGTPARVEQLLVEMAQTPPRTFIGNYPAWTALATTPQMEELARIGDDAFDALVANLDHYALRPAVIQILGDMASARAVRLLTALLWREDTGLQIQRLVLTSLGRIVRHPESFTIYSRWPREDARRLAQQVYDLSGR